MIEQQIIWSPGISLEQIEQQCIQKAYAHFHQNKTVTANALGIAINTLAAKLAKYEEQALSHTAHLEQEKAKQDEWLRKSRGYPPNDVGSPYSPHVHSSVPTPQAAKVAVQVQVAHAAAKKAK